MNPSSSSAQAQPPANALPQYTTRPEIRYAIFGILIRNLRQRFEERSPPGATLHISKSQRLRTLRQSNVLEDILYRRATCLDKYQDLSTLEGRVFEAGRALYANSQRRQMECENQRRMIGVGEDPAARWRASQAQAAVRMNGAHLRRSESF